MSIFNHQMKKPAAAAAIVLVLLLGVIILSACGGESTSPTSTAGAQTAASDTSEAEEPGAPTHTAPGVVDKSTEEPAVEVNQTPGPDRKTSTPKPQITRSRPTATPYVFETDEFGMPMYPTDSRGNYIFPTDDRGEVILATDEVGYPILPIDEEGNLVIPTDASGQPIFPTDEAGFPILPEPTFEDDITTDSEEPPVEETTQGGDLGDIEETPEEVSPPGNGDLPGGGELLPTPSPIVWSTPVSNKPLGDPENPFVFGIVVAREGDLDRAAAMEELTERLSSDTGLSFVTQQTGSYAELLTGMRAGAVHAAFLQPFTYIIAQQRGYATAALITKHYGVEAYATSFLANASDPDLTAYFDPNSGKSTAGPEEALPQFAGKRPCWVDSMSASGYVAPLGYLVQNEVDLQPPLFMMSHTGVVRALYIQGICDFGAVFGILGDPRTASVIQQDLPDVMSKVVVVWQSDAVIPTLNLSIQSQVPEASRIQIIEAVVDLAAASDGNTLLTRANGYVIQGVREIEDSYYDPLRGLLRDSSVNIRTLLGK